MHAQKNELILYFHSAKKEDRTVRAYALSLDKHKLNERDLAHEPLTNTQLAGLAADLSIPVKDLLDPGVDIIHHDYSDEDLLTMMAHDHTLIRTPIAYLGDRVFFVASEYALIKEDLDI